MARVILRFTCLLTIAAGFALASPVFAQCGNGIVENGEECDPGGPRTLGATADGRPCTSGGTCFFVNSGGCCKFNCQAVGSGLACDDHNACSVGEHCNQVGICECAGGCDPTASVGSVCRASTGDCDPAEICQQNTGCPADQKSPNGTACTADSNPCTADQCNGTSALCQHPAGNPGAVCRPSGGECDPAETCTGSSTTCPPEANPSGTVCTDDGNICTNDVCDANGDCGHPNNTAPCDDGLFCNGTDSCSNGACLPGNSDPCSGGGECADHCNENADNCFDGYGTLCTSDENVCTDDKCNGTGTCVHLNNTATCDDGLFCTVGDICGGGACNGTTRDCTDGSSCTTDSCNEVSNTCVHNTVAGSGTPCDDENICTENTTCNPSGGCTGGTTINCSDAVACTTDSCHPVTGCQHVASADSRSCANGCEDGVDNEGNGDTDLEDAGCATLAKVQRFAVVSTHDTSRKALYSGSDATVASIDADGVCNTGTSLCECATPGPLHCLSLGFACSSDADCRTSVAGTCNLTTNECECPGYAPNCQALGRPCTVEADCAIAPYPFGDSLGGVCGYNMEIRAGTHFGMLNTSGNLSFGKGSSVDRNLDILGELSSDGGLIVTKQSAPLVGPIVCSSDLDLVCEPDTVCPDAPLDTCQLGSCTGHEEACLIDADCAPACDARRRINDGACSNDANLRCTLDSECGAGNTCEHPFVFTDSSSDNWQRCDTVLALDPNAASGVSQLLENIANEIAAYTPAPEESVAFPAGCISCPTPATPNNDPSCVPCPDTGQIKADSSHQKYVVTVGGGTQFLDLTRVKLPGLTELHLLGQEDTVLVVRLGRGLRLGGQARIVLGSNGGSGLLQAEHLLWNMAGKAGGTAALSRAARFYGTILAPERPGIRTGSGVTVDGSLMSRKIQIKQTTVVNHVPFTPLLPLP